MIDATGNFFGVGADMKTMNLTAWQKIVFRKNGEHYVVFRTLHVLQNWRRVPDFGKPHPDRSSARNILVT